MKISDINCEENSLMKLQALSFSHYQSLTASLISSVPLPPLVDSSEAYLRHFIFHTVISVCIYKRYHSFLKKTMIALLGDNSNTI